MLCPNCKKEIENGSAFCEHCGARIKKSKKGLWITLGVIFMAVMATIVVITIQEQQEQMAIRISQQPVDNTMVNNEDPKLGCGLSFLSLLIPLVGFVLCFKHRDNDI